jgi:predicted nucleic-acid-binding protein
MISVDTNVLARYLLRDDEAQWAIADRLINNSAIFVPASVILELVWLLSSRYKIPQTPLHQMLTHLLEAERVVVEAAPRFWQALSYQESGLDFADALHLASSNDCASLATFDQAFIKAAAATQLTPIPVTHP